MSAGQIDTGNGVDMELWRERFDPQAYLKERFTDVEKDDRHMFRLWNLFQTGSYGGTLLEIGSGPTVFTAIAASGTHSEIHLTDYSRANLDCIQSWLDGLADAHQWDGHIGAIADKENTSIEKVTARTKSRVKSLFELNLIEKTDELLQKVTMQFNTVVCIFTFEAACGSLEELNQATRNIFALLEAGGRVIVVMSLGSQQCKAGNDYFRLFSVTGDQLLQCFIDAGFVECNLEYIQVSKLLKTIIDTPGFQLSCVTAQKPA